ncbi:MAG TPA: glycosyltransferase [Ktedonobacterales bacterium]|nr:glycosyltransferase [Ktedonobacterales bacterium]
MRVLFITPYLPSRIRVRAYGFVCHLAPRHRVTVVAAATVDVEQADVEALRARGIAVRLVTEPRAQRYLRSLRALATDQPLQVAFGASPRLRAAIGDELASNTYDVVHVEHLRAVGALPAHCPVPVVWDAVDCVSQLFEEGARHASSSVLRAFGRQEARRTRAFESRQLHRFPHVLVTSARDRQYLLDTLADQPEDRATRLAEITPVPNGVDQEYFRPYAGTRRPETLVFSGKMSYHANVAGVLTLVHRILPLIWKARPTVKVVIAGSNPPRQIRDLARDPRIEVTGYVADLRPLIAQAQIAVSPLPYAVGVQNKILEAMALGTPVVTSPAAASGLQAVDGRDLLVADTPEAFASTVLRLLENTALCQSLVAHGLAFVATNHDWERIATQITEVYSRAQLQAVV